MVSTSARTSRSSPRILHRLGPFLNPPAEGVLVLETDEEHQAPVIADVVGQVVQDPPRFRHAAGGDDHRRTGHGVQFL